MTSFPSRRISVFALLGAGLSLLSLTLALPSSSSQGATYRSRTTYRHSTKTYHRAKTTKVEREAENKAPKDQQTIASVLAPGGKLDAQGRLPMSAEIALGRSMVREVAGRFGPTLPDTDPMSQRVARIGKQFAALSSRKGIPFSYHVVKNDKVINAFAIPGGPIFITTAMMKLASNDAEVAAVLGHETGHIEHRDTARTIENLKRSQGIVGSVLSQYLGKARTQGSADVTAGLTSIGFILLNMGNQRDAETHADEAGIRWMSKLGYDPRAMVTLFDKMRLKTQGKGSTASAFLRTHPETSDREILLTSLIKQENLLAVAKAGGGPRLNYTATPLVLAMRK